MLNDFEDDALKKSGWVSVADRLPTAEDGKVFEVVCERHPEDHESGNPPDGCLEVKIAEIAQGIFASVYRFDVEMAGWKARWWRPADEQVARKHLEAKTPYLRIHARKGPREDVIIEGNACGLLKLKFLLDDILRQGEKSAEFFDAEGERYSVLVSEKPLPEVKSEA